MVCKYDTGHNILVPRRTLPFLLTFKRTKWNQNQSRKKNYKWTLDTDFNGLTMIRIVHFGTQEANRVHICVDVVTDNAMRQNENE